MAAQVGHLGSDGADERALISRFSCGSKFNRQAHVKDEHPAMFGGAASVRVWTVR